jgi:hypothetical protein
VTVAAVLPIAGVRVVGVVLLLSALAKAVVPHRFAAHLVRLAGLPPRLAEAIGAAVAVGEAALAMPLIVEAGPPAAKAATLVLLAVLSIATLWAWRLGRIEECGCYGPFLSLSPPVSSAINLTMILLLAGGLTARDSAAVRSSAIAWAAISGVLLALAVLGLPRLTGRIAAGRRWPAGWLPQVKMAQGDGDRIVAFLEPGCNRCQAWAKALWMLSAKPDFPAISVVSPYKWKDGAGLEEAPQLPTVVCGEIRLWLLGVEAPMAAVVRVGRIAEVWRQAMPAAWVAILRGRQANR